MSKPLSWLFRLGLMLAVLAPTAAWADAPTSSVIVGNGDVTLGVGYDAGLNEAGTGLQFVPTGTEGLAQMCVCSAWSLVVGQAPTSQMVESFTFDDLGARSSVLVDDVATASHLRVTHDFHVAPNTTNLYEVTVTVQNLGGTTVLPAYTRTLVWAAGPPDLSGLAIDPALGTLQPSTDGQGIQFGIGLPPIQAGATDVFRLYLGAGSTRADASVGLIANGATLISLSQTETTAFVLGYAAGAALPVELNQPKDSGVSGNRGGGGGGGGGGGPKPNSPQPKGDTDQGG